MHMNRIVIDPPKSSTEDTGIKFIFEMLKTPSARISFLVFPALTQWRHSKNI